VIGTGAACPFIVMKKITNNEEFFFKLPNEARGVE
jgi:hypothetical protein